MLEEPPVGALAFLDDTEASLAAYRRATDKVGQIEELLAELDEQAGPVRRLPGSVSVHLVADLRIRTHSGSNFDLKLCQRLLAGARRALNLGELGNGGRVEVREGVVDTGTDAPAVFTCVMHPHTKTPKKGRCQICFMDLIPATAAHR